MQVAVAAFEECGLNGSSTTEGGSQSGPQSSTNSNYRYTLRPISVTSIHPFAHHLDPALRPGVACELETHLGSRSQIVIPYLLVRTTIRIDPSSRFCSLSAFGAGMSFAAFFTCETPCANRPRRQLSGSPQDREFSADWFRRFFSRKIVWAPAALSAPICPISS